MERFKTILKNISPVGLIGLSLFLLVYGATMAGLVAFAAGVAVLLLAHKPALKKAHYAGAATFMLAAMLGLPAALYNFSTESCVGSALDLSDGDVRSMSDPRLSAQDRIWAQRTYEAVRTEAEISGLSALGPETIANVLVAAPGYVRAVVSDDREQAPAGAIARAKEALVAKIFDRRQVCHAFGAGPVFAYLVAKTRDEDQILKTADAALATVTPALKASFVAAPTLAEAGLSSHLAAVDGAKTSR